MVGTIDDEFRLCERRIFGNPLVVNFLQPTGYVLDCRQVMQF
jgi:hypothetical protein